MSSTILIAVVLLLLGGALCIWLLKPLILTITTDLPGLFERTAIKRRERLLPLVDECLDNGNTVQAYRLLRDAFFLDLLKRDASALDKLNNHHLSIMARLVMLADKHSRHLNDLPLVESLLLTRYDLMRTRFEIRKAANSIEKKQVERGKDPATWARAEFKRRLKELNEQLAVNRQSLEKTIKSLFESLQQMQEVNEVRYH